jgi:hypothetical protein
MEVSRLIRARAVHSLGKTLPFSRWIRAGRTAELLWTFWGRGESLASAESRKSAPRSFNLLSECTIRNCDLFVFRAPFISSGNTNFEIERNKFHLETYALPKIFSGFRQENLQIFYSGLSTHQNFI